MTTTDLVPVENMAAIEQMDKASAEVAVTAYLTDARDRLAQALAATGPEAVAALKAEIATAAEATKQLGLSKEIQLDAAEMVRRAEFALGKAIRAGQEAGEIAKRGSNRANLRNSETHVRELSSPYDFATRPELQGADGTTGIYALAEASEEQFDAAITEAKDEGNLSRANVARKINAEQAAPRRKPITDEFRSVIVNLNSVARQIDRLANDDRFNKNVGQIADLYFGDLTHAHDVLQHVINQIGENR